MSDLISRQAALKAIHDLPNCHNGYSDSYDKACIIGVIEDLPTIDPVKHGRLIDGIVSFHWTCSECGCHLRKDLGQVFERETDRYNYCPNCGAKMDGGEE